LARLQDRDDEQRSITARQSVAKSRREAPQRLHYACGVCDARYYGRGAAEGCCGLLRVFAEVER